MRWLTVGVLFLAVACGPAPDPGRDRLGAGDEAIARADLMVSGRPDTVVLGVGAGRGDLGFSITVIDVGTRIRIVDDPGPDADDGRMVQVKVIDGDQAGRVGTVVRKNIRPTVAR